MLRSRIRMEHTAENRWKMHDWGGGVHMIFTITCRPGVIFSG